MVIPDLWLALWVHIVPPNPKISKFLWGNSQSPAPTMPDPLQKIQRPDRICSLMSSLICKNPHGHTWSVAGIVGACSSPKTKNFEISMGEFTLHQSNQEPLKKNQPPDRIYSWTCSLICTNPRVSIWSVCGTVGAQSSPKPKNLEIPVGSNFHPAPKYPRTP